MDGKLKKFRDLNQEIRECKRCKLWKTRRNALPGEGNIHAKLMLVAQAPGYNEDREGRMFIGPSGKKLDKLLEDANIKRKDIYITNLIKCLLPHYRKPRPDEIKICTRYLDKEIEWINPSIISPLGYFATRYIFEKYNISRSGLEFSGVYGRVFLTEDKKILPLQHPAALLYNESIQKDMIKNFRKLKRLLIQT